MSETTDLKYLRDALDLARKGVGLASPNPCVGAVIADRQGVVAGRGWHEYDKLDHAEVVALREAGARAQGGTLYINLEPCSHQGRTPPCADAVIAAKVARVVALMRDPNPRVGGNGFARLREAGVKIEIVGEHDPRRGEELSPLEIEARKLNEAFAKYIRTGLPFVTLKAGMTLDGKIAEKPGHKSKITGEQSWRQVQELRHASDAIMTGIGTVLADDPLLTDRSEKARRRPLLRVIVDSKLRIPLDSQLVRTAKKDLIVFCAFGDETKRKSLEDRGVIVVETVAQGDHVDVAAALKHLATLQITSVLLEGGARLNGAAFARDLVDKVFLFIAPRILGDEKAVPLVSGTATFENARLYRAQSHRFGEDFGIEGYLRDPFACVT